MPNSHSAERARVEVERQLEQLNELRNASTRDQDFKLWRQTTLTLIQRTWPGDESRPARFRRIPFTPTSTRADRDETREWFERGCGEAAVFLRELICDLAENGMAPVRKAANRIPEPLPNDDVPMLTLGGDRAQPAPARPAISPPAVAQPGPARPGAAAPAGRSAAPHARGGRTARSSRRPAPRVRLKDMLGFDDASQVASPSPALGTPKPAARDAAGETPRSASLPPIGAPPEFQPPPAPEPRRAPESPGFDEAALQRALEAALHSFMSRDPEPSALDLLNASPVFNAMARPVRRRDANAEGTYRTPAAVAVAVIATELSALDVPHGHHAGTRAALLDLAKHLDQHDLTWEALREAVGFVMEFPPVAKRVLPLLLPFFEEAA
ncbi:MAG: hypothetical protein HYR73_05265 [Candidatus Eisenbacteria bacterium]|nr:hypothetical protein [Candidatus Eisenbacteria bacterium]